MASGGSLGGLIIAAFFGAACWLAIGLLVFVTIVPDAGWLVPLLVGAGLLIGCAIGLGPAFFYRREARALEAALESVAAEVADRLLLQAEAEETPVVRQHVSVAELTKAHWMGRREQNGDGP